MKFVVRNGGNEKTVLIDKVNGVFHVEIDGRKVDVDCSYFGDSGYMSVLIGNKSYLIEAAPTDALQGEYYARVMGRHYDLDVLDDLLVAVRDAESALEASGDHVINSPMPGLIVEIKVKEGDRVVAGTPVVIMEAMKMQNELVSEAAGVVKEIHVGESDAVDSQRPLVRIERD